MFDIISFIILILVGLFAFIVFILLWASRDEKKKREHELTLAQLKSEQVPERADGSNVQVVREKEIIKEVVMIPCQYCGSLMPQTSLFCNNCGAKRKA